MKRITLGAIVLTAAALLAGCAPQAEYKSIEELRDAFVDAGGECPDFSTDGPSAYSIESASCSSSAVIAIYADHEAVQRQTSMVKNTVGKLIGGERLIGENWMISAPNLDAIQKELGGEIIHFTKD